jgi:hypothetical protein
VFIVSSFFCNSEEETVRFYLPDEGVALQEQKFLMQHRMDVKEGQLKAAETKTKKLLKISAKIRLDATNAKATTGGGEEQVSEVDSESGDDGCLQQ